ncbi:LPS assembly lipoprotein LptE [Luteolibacter sp. LG18]|uniref:LPS assembly lipoprotein LptE n=1 Tax=Luteolibacter sp. LG18 TaxID=2819286 RepID=UPI0030C72401
MMRLLAVSAAVALSSCAGYQLGGVKPASLARIKTIQVPMFGNDTQHPRAEAIATSAVASALAQDGTYRISNLDKADAVLEGRIRRIDYLQIRGERLDTLRPQELQNTVTLSWTLKDAKDPTKVLANGNAVGHSQFFVDANLQTSRNNALSDALERAADSLVSKLANGY